MNNFNKGNKLNNQTYKQRTIVFDIDDTLGHFNEELSRWLSEHLDDPAIANHHTKWESYQISHLYPQIKDWPEVWYSLEREGVIERLRPVAAGIKLLQECKRRGYNVVALTARGWMKDPKGTTEAWFKSVGIEVDELIVCPIDKPKADYLPKGVKVDLFLDDNIEHIESCSPAVGACLIVSQPWNRTLTPKMDGPPSERLRNVFRVIMPDEYRAREIDYSDWLDELLKLGDGVGPRVDWTGP